MYECATPHIWCVIHFSSCFAAYYAVAIMYRAHTLAHNITICLVIFFSLLLLHDCLSIPQQGEKVSRVFFFPFFVYIVFALDYFALCLVRSLCACVCAAGGYTTISFIADLLGDLLEGFSFVCAHIFSPSCPTHFRRINFIFVILFVHCFRLLVMLWHFFFSSSSSSMFMHCMTVSL